MKLYRYIIAAALVLQASAPIMAQEDKPDTLFVRYDDRFKANGTLLLGHADSIDIGASSMKIYDATTELGFTTKTYTTLIPTDACDMTFRNPGRWLLKPSIYGGTDYTNDAATSGYNFKHSMESEHFALFWDVQFGETATYIKHPNAGNVANAYNVLDIAERCWNKYVELGFVKPGASTTDKYKIQLYIPYQSDWRADASGTNGVNGELTGIGHFTPWAASSNSTVAHEVGHTFQFLVHADCGWDHGFDYGYGTNASGNNGWWESCANWQAYKVLPAEQFENSDFYSHLGLCHLNILNEAWRYQNFFIQDWWCMKHGSDFIGRLWRESLRPEDPVEAYMRLNNLTLPQFCDEQMEGIMRMATWDIDGVRDYAAEKIGQHQTHLHKAAGTTSTWEVDAAYCPENFGYNIINMNTTRTAGLEVKAHFKGIAGADGYRKVRTANAGWRYGFVAYTTDNRSIRGDIFSEAEATATFTLPEKCSRVFFVVMGAPKTYWRHPWDDNDSNDEQWPYQVTFENINISGYSNP